MNFFEVRSFKNNLRQKTLKLSIIPKRTNTNLKSKFQTIHYGSRYRKLSSEGMQFLACCLLCHFGGQSLGFQFPSVSDMWNAEVWTGSPFLWQICLQWLWKVCNIHYLSWPWVSCTTSQDLAKLKPGMSNLHTNKFSVMTESGLELKSPLPSHPRWLSDSPRCQIHIPSPTSSLSTIMAESVYPVLI